MVARIVRAEDDPILYGLDIVLNMTWSLSGGLLDPKDIVVGI